MSQVFILQNHDGYFLSKQKEWLDGRDANLLYRSPHRDEALNQMVEVNAKDYLQRISIIECELSEKRQPMLNPDELPEPRAKVKEQASETDGDTDADQSSEVIAEVTEHSDGEPVLAPEDTASQASDANTDDDAATASLF